MEERHIHPRQYIEDSLCVRMGGRCAELLVYGDLSTGAANDLVGNTELARKMVREWGMSDAIGPMAWGSQGQVFLGEDLMHTRDYSEDTSKVIDDEVERILRAEEQRAMDVLSKHRGGLNAIARALLDNEIIDGAEVARLVDEAHGSPVHTEGAKSVPHFTGAPSTGGQRAWQRRRSGAGDRGSPVAVGGHGSVAAGSGAAQSQAPGAGPPRPFVGPPRGPVRDLAAPAVAARGLRGRAPARPAPGGRGTSLNPAPEPIRSRRRHEGGWWSTSCARELARRGLRVAPSARPA